MNDLAEKVLELASEDEEFNEGFMHAADLDAIVALLKEKGIEATAEELEAALRHEEVDQLSDEELEAVAGGKACACVLGGGGVAGGKDDTCGCALGGVGFYKPGTDGLRCACPSVGGGSTSE